MKVFSRCCRVLETAFGLMKRQETTLSCRSHSILQQAVKPCFETAPRTSKRSAREREEVEGPGPCHSAVFREDDSAATEADQLRIPDRGNEHEIETGPKLRKCLDRQCQRSLRWLQGMNRDPPEAKVVVGVPLVRSAIPARCCPSSTRRRFHVVVSPAVIVSLRSITPGRDPAVESLRLFWSSATKWNGESDLILTNPRLPWARLDSSSTKRDCWLPAAKLSVVVARC